jgi:hypothetical protein
MPDGSRTCSYCGSLHPDDVVDILYQFLEDPAYHFSTTDKGYKFYANRPGTQNASQGGIKYYTWHDEGWEGVEAAYRLALPVMQLRWNEKFGRT